MSKMKNILWLLLLLALAACAPATPVVEAPVVDATEAPQVEPTPEPEPVVVSDDLNNEIVLAETPQAIISLSPSITEILYAIGAGGQLVGRDDYSLFPDEVLEVTSVGSLWGELPIEPILALEPDLIIVAEIITPEQVQALEDLGLQVFWQANPSSFDELYANILEVAVLSGHEAEAEALIDDLKARVAAVEEAVDGASTTPTVFYEVDATDPANPWTAGGGTFIDTIISMAGGENVAAQMDPYPQISAESLIALNPQVILLADALYGVTPEQVAERPGWDAIQAVQELAIYGIDPNMMSVPGPRLVDALEETARLLHPELFE